MEKVSIFDFRSGTLKGKKSVESGKCLRRKRNESVLNVFPFRVNQLGLIFRRPSYSLSSPVISFPFAF